ncbi:hypothetical protein SLEP1_g26179 [Rubroshorea leprosula]|uniref:Uncharacterized protein n=1 Tax=Rubroshorea leprosula TaxID=152421 RepID=A0AAV5JWW3_9ROSI|nr:hypothetical protein SLEP1_g26179 [Rubroshorea leprosula]
MSKKTVRKKIKRKKRSRSSSSVEWAEEDMKITPQSIEASTSSSWPRHSRKTQKIGQRKEKISKVVGAVVSKLHKRQQIERKLHRWQQKEKKGELHRSTVAAKCSKINCKI